MLDLLEDEISTRKTKVEASYEADKQAFNDQIDGPAVASADLTPRSGQGGDQRQALSNKKTTAVSIPP